MGATQRGPAPELAMQPAQRISIPKQGIAAKVQRRRPFFDQLLLSKTFKITLGLQGAGLPLAKERDVHGMGKPIYHCAGDAAERKAQRGGENRRGLIDKAKLCRA